jgi:hypothetical protein
MVGLMKTKNSRKKGSTTMLSLLISSAFLLALAAFSLFFFFRDRDIRTERVTAIKTHDKYLSRMEARSKDAMWEMYTTMVGYEKQ